MRPWALKTSLGLVAMLGMRLLWAEVERSGLASYACFVGFARVIGQEHAPIYSMRRTPIDFEGHRFEVPESLVDVAEKLLGDKNLSIDDRKYYLGRLLTYTGERRFPRLSPGFRSRRDDSIITRALQAKARNPDHLPLAASEDLVVVTHQAAPFQLSTASLLAHDSHLKNVPSVVLTSEVFPVRAEQLLKVADEIRYSDAGTLGEIPKHLNRFHLMGGYCGMCQTRTLRDIVGQVGSLATEKPLEIYVYAGQSYVANAEMTAQNLAHSLSSGQEANLSRALGLEGVISSPERAVQTAYGPGIELNVYFTDIKQGRPIRVVVLRK